MQDVEKTPVEPKLAAAAGSGASSVDESGIGGGRDTGVLAKLRGLEAAMDRKMGVETQGIERRRPEDRDPAYASFSNQTVMFLMWMSATTNLGCFSTGFLGWELELDPKRSIVIIIFSTLVGSSVTVRTTHPPSPIGLFHTRLSLGDYVDESYSTRAGAQPWAPGRAFARCLSRATRWAGGPPKSSPSST